MSLCETFQKELLIEICNVISGKLTPISGYWPSSYLLQLQKDQVAVWRQVWTHSDPTKRGDAFLTTTRVMMGKKLMGFVLETFSSNCFIQKVDLKLYKTQGDCILQICFNCTVMKMILYREVFSHVRICTCLEGISACILCFFNSKMESERHQQTLIREKNVG